jgi:hypothetical protein
MRASSSYSAPDVAGSVGVTWPPPLPSSTRAPLRAPSGDTIETRVARPPSTVNVTTKAGACSGRKTFPPWYSRRVGAFPSICPANVPFSSKTRRDMAARVEPAAATA